jgi:hypothetical protein
MKILNLQHYDKKHVFTHPFSKLYLGFHFWTFIFVHFRKPKRLLEIYLLLKNTPKNNINNCYELS